MTVVVYVILTFVIFAVPVFAQTSENAISDTIEQVLLTDIRYRRTSSLSFTRDTVRYYDRFRDNARALFDRMPGVLAFNGENFAQDNRISVRGYGSRSAFGIRGVRMYLDGVPLTSPDGTTQIDELSIFDISHLDVVRSGMSARLGNAAGGTLALNTAGYRVGLETSARVNTFGSWDFGLKYGFGKDKNKHLLSLNHHSFTGKREYSSAANTTLLWKSRIHVSGKWLVDLFQSGYHSPKGNDPGALTVSEFMANPFAASQRNITFRAGESVSGFTTAARSSLTVTAKSILLSGVYVKKRFFDGKLPVAAGGDINLDRLAAGIWNTLEINPGKNITLTLGQTADIQDDHRTLRANNNGSQGEVSADQKEKVLNLGFFEQAEVRCRKVYLQQMLRYDLNRYGLKDLYLADGIQDGSLSFNNYNGSLALGWEPAKKWTLFASLATTFEMPTLNELTNNPAGQGGFNRVLLPERSLQWEAGVKKGASAGTSFSLAIFRILAIDQITAYELPDTPGRTYYRNAGKTVRNGMEWDFRTPLLKALVLRVNGLLYDFRFSEYVAGTSDFSGNKQPLVPVFKTYGSLEWQLTPRWRAMIAVTRQAGMYLNDANTVKAPAQTLFDAGITADAGHGWHIGLTAANMFGLYIYSNFRQNAAAGRYYEAASPFHMALFFRYSAPGYP